MKISSMFLAVGFFLFAMNHAYAQKANITEKDAQTWVEFRNGRLSDNGEYCLYTHGPRQGAPSLVIQSTRNKFKRIIPGVVEIAKFTNDSKNVIFKIKDTLIILDVANNKRVAIKEVSSFETFNLTKQPIIIYSSNGRLLAYNYKTGKSENYGNMLSYQAAADGTFLLLQTKHSLNYIDLQKQTKKLIYKSENIAQITIDLKHKQMAFISHQNSLSDKKSSIVYYKIGQYAPKIIAADGDFKSGLSIGSDELVFNKEGTKIFFTVKKEKPKLNLKKVASVDVWNHKDEYLQSEQAGKQLVYKEKLPAVVNLNSNVLVLDTTEFNTTAGITTNSRGNFILSKSMVLPYRSFNYTKDYWPTLELISTTDGQRKMLISQEMSRIENECISPDEKFVIWYNYDKKAYYTYEIETGKTRNITSSWPIKAYRENAERKYDFFVQPPAGWLVKDSFVIIYDNFDVWRVDPLGEIAPINLTKGYGRKNDVTFRVIDTELTPTGPTNSSYVFKDGQKLILTCINLESKDYSLFSLNLRDLNSLEMLSTFPAKQSLESCAKGGNAYLQVRQNFNSSRNLYFSKNLKKFTQLTDYQPQKKYNYLTAELIKYDMSDGRKNLGILYKPENFDPGKKYPVIFQYYAYRSNEFHDFLGFPDPLSLKGADISIPYYVVNDYLVFVPDMRYEVGHPARSFTTTVVSAAIYLKKMPWVDSTKMGLNGHSFGGYITNCIIANTNMFAAAIEGAGPTNLSSSSGGLYRTSSAINYVAFSQPSIENYLWERPDLYVENSPVFSISKITTPLLIVHNKADSVVPFQQGLELFTGLRHAHKKAWMLQYDDSDHNILGSASPQDLSIRSRQFFDHYLKGKPAPIWMTRGVPFKLKGSEDGLAIDSAGSCGNDCKVCIPH